MILEELEKRAWTQHELARKLGLSDAQVSRLLRGRRPLRTAQARRIAGILGIKFRLTRHGTPRKGPPKDKARNRTVRGAETNTNKGVTR